MFSTKRLRDLISLPKREEVYIQRINEIIERYDYFQLSKNNNLEKFIREITKVLTDLRLKNDKMFVLSFISFLYKFDNFEIINELHKGSNSDKIIKASYTSQRGEEKIIIKIQNIDENLFKKDIILIEILSASIFILIKKLNPDLISSINKYTIDLGISYVSYYDEIWNYKELIDFTSPNSPYNINNKKKDFKLCHIYISNFIEGETLNFYYHSLYYKQNPNILLINKILNTNFEILYDFLILLGSKYGYYHGDLHLSNIIYSVYREGLVIIDYGRTLFNIDNPRFINAINKITQFQIKKLGYNIPETYGYDDIINKYIQRNYKNYKNLFIFDIISYSLNIYLFCINHYLYKDFSKIISENLFVIKFKEMYDFKIIFKLNSSSTYINEKIEYLKDEYIKIRNSIDNKTQKILDGIIFFCLTNIDNNLFDCKNLFLYVNYEKKQITKFLEYFDTFIHLFNDEEKELLSSTNPLYSYLFNITGGGKKRKYENSKFTSFLA